MGKRDPYYLDRDLRQYRRRYPHVFPELENTPDFHRGEMRLAAEVAIAVIRRTPIPYDQDQAFESARLKAFEVLGVLAKG